MFALQNHVGYPQAVRLPRATAGPDRGLHDQPEDVRRLGVRRGRLRLDHHVRQQHHLPEPSGSFRAPRPGGSTCRRTSPTPCGRYYVHTRLGACGYDTLEDPASLYPARRRPLHDRQRPGPPGRRRLGDRRGARRDATTRTTGAASSSACPASTRPPTCGVAWTTPDRPPSPVTPMTHMDFAAADRRRPGRPDPGRARGHRRARQHAGGAHRRPRLRGGPRTSTAPTTRRRTTASTTGTTATSRTTSRHVPDAAGRPEAAGRRPATSATPTATRWSARGSRTSPRPRSTRRPRSWRSMPDGLGGVASQRRPLRPGLADPLGPDDQRRGEVVVRAARRRSSSTPRRADYGPDLIATLVDDTTYSVAGDHGGIQRATQQIPIVFAGGGRLEQGPARGGALGRHHADDPAAAGDRADLPDGRSGLPAAGRALTRAM